MSDRQAEIFVIAVTPNPNVAMCVGLWDYGRSLSKPYLFEANKMSGVADVLEKKRGYRIFENVSNGFEFYIAVARDIDAEQAIKSGKAFLVEVAMSMLDIGGAS